MKALFTPAFLRSLSKLPFELQQEVAEKVTLFKEDPQNPQLKTHKLKGRFKGCLAFSVNYKTRVIFEYTPQNDSVLLSVGNHDVYKR